jgi:hypothetical protein
MKTFVICIVLGLSAFLLEAEEPAIQYSRSFFELGASFTIGDTLATDNTGGGICYKWNHYFDSSNPSGCYYGFLSGYYFHGAGGVDLADTKYVTFGYRGLVTPWLGLDVSLSPVLGARIYENTLDGCAYLGVGPTMGFFVPVNDSIDLSLSYEPVFNLYTFDGKTEVRNKSYNDIVFLIVFKSYTQEKKLKWQ